MSDNHDDKSDFDDILKNAYSEIEPLDSWHVLVLSFLSVSFNR